MGSAELNALQLIVVLFPPCASLCVAIVPSNGQQLSLDKLHPQRNTARF